MRPELGGADSLPRSLVDAEPSQKELIVPRADQTRPPNETGAKVAAFPARIVPWAASGPERPIAKVATAQEEAASVQQIAARIAAGVEVLWHNPRSRIAAAHAPVSPQPPNAVTASIKRDRQAQFHGSGKVRTLLLSLVELRRTANTGKISRERLHLMGGPAR